MLLSGDLMDGETVYRETAQALSQALGGIPCPVFLAPGNHDCYSPSSVYATLDWPDNVHIFTSPAVEGVDLPQLNCTVYGRAFCSPHETDSPLAGFQAAEDGRLTLACLHGDTAPGSGYGPISQEEIAAQRPGLSGPGPRPPVQRPAAGGADRLGLSRLSRGPGL